MTRRFVKLLSALAAVGALLSSGAARAQEEIEITGPLKGQPAVRNMRLYRQGRFTLAPSISFSLLDQYRRTIFAGGSLAYNITDWLAIGVWGAAGAIYSDTDLATQIDKTSDRDPLTAENVNHSNSPTGGHAPFTAQTAKMSWVIVPQLTFIPFRGKLAIFNKIFVDTDFFVSAGPYFMGIQERADCSGTDPKTGIAACASPSAFALTSRTKILGTAAIGLTFYPSNFVSFGVEYRGLPMFWNRGGFDSRGGPPNGNFPDFQVNSSDETFDFYQMVSIFVGFSLPAAPRISD
jgi:hypothetical protein